MTRLDMLIFVIAAALGCYGATISLGGEPRRVINVAWLVILIYMLLRLLGLVNVTI